MEVLGAVSSVITIIDTTRKLISYYGEVKNAGHDVARLQKSLESHRIAVEGVQALLESQDGRHLETTQKLRSALDRSQQQLKILSTTLQEGIDKRNQPSGSGMRDKLRQKMSKLGLDKQSLEWPFQRKEIDGIVNDLHQCQSVLSAALQIDSTAAASMAHQRNVLAQLPIASGASIDSQANERDPRCHPDTRKEILSQIFSWNEDPQGRCIFWLFGMAGTGKSTICRTVADQLRQKHVPVATYLFKKGEGDRGTAKRFFTTLAAQIVHQVPCIASHVQDALEKDPFIADKSKKEQFEMLILKPLEKCKGLSGLPAAIAVAVDALDECDQDDDARAIIRLFSIAKESLTSVRLRFFITSRPDIHIRLGFQSIGDRYADFALHEIPKPDIESDIRRFLQWKLAIIRDEFNTAASSDWLASDWPNAESLERLVGIAVPLFIFAATACRFIADTNYGDPGDQLETILSSQRSYSLPRLHATYLPILDQLLLERTEYGWTRRAQENEERIIQSFRALIGPIVILAEPLSRNSLARLLHTPQRVLDRHLSGLHSVLNIPKDDSLPVKLLHLSFRDFLVNSANRDHNPFWIDEQEAQATLGSHCLSLLSAPGALKNDICNLQQPGRSRSDLELETISRCLQPEVQYACRYWVFHMKQGQCRLRDDGEVYRFLATHFLHWIEALSLIGRVSESVAMIEDLLSLLENENSTRVSSFLRDAKRTTLRDRRLWDEYPLQIYHSTLVFLPERSIIRKVFGNQYPSYLSQVRGLDTNWDLHLQSFDIGNEAHSLGMFSFSSNSRLLCLASAIRIEVWDIVAGQQVMQVPGKPSLEIIFCSDGCTLALTSSTALRPSQAAILDIATSSYVETMTTLEDPMKNIHQCVFSADGKWLAAVHRPGENDENVEYEKDKYKSRDSKSKRAAAFTFQLYNLDTREWGPTLQTWHEFEEMVVFSTKEETRLALRCRNDLTIWDFTTGSHVGSLRLNRQLYTPGRLFPFAFSPDGQLLASACSLRSVKTGQVEKELEYSKGVRSVHFSPDGCQLLIVSIQSQITTVLDVRTGRQLGEFPSSRVAPPAISPDGTLLATLAENRRVLDIWGLERRASPAGSGNAAETFTKIIANPRENQLLCFGTNECPAKIYDMNTWEVVAVLDSNLGPVIKPVLSIGGNHLAFAREQDGEGVVWDIAAGQAVMNFQHSFALYPLSFSPDGTRLAVGGKTQCDLWELSKPDEPITIYTGAWSFAFSPDSLFLATGSQHGKVSIWEAATGYHSKTWSCSQSGYLFDFIFLSDSKRIVVHGTFTDRVSIWDIETETCIGNVEFQDVPISPRIVGATSTSLVTTIGDFECSAMSSVRAAPNQQIFAYRRGFGISDDYRWILWRDQRMLFLPSPYRPSHWEDIEIVGTKVVILLPSKRIMCLEFSGQYSTLP